MAQTVEIEPGLPSRNGRIGIGEADPRLAKLDRIHQTRIPSSEVVALGSAQQKWLRSSFTGQAETSPSKLT